MVVVAVLWFAACLLLINALYAPGLAMPLVSVKECKAQNIVVRFDLCPPLFCCPARLPLLPFVALLRRAVVQRVVLRTQERRVRLRPSAAVVVEHGAVHFPAVGDAGR